MPLPLPFARASATLLSAALWATLACGAGDEGPPPATAAAERQRIERIVVATGTIEPEKQVEVRPRIAGIVEVVHVESGDEVAEGDVLIEIERDLIEAQVREARASLESARVGRRFAKIGVDRVLKLQRENAASDQDLDDARAAYERAVAEQARAKAVLERLETTLRYATVRSPLAGRVLDVVTEEGNAVSPVTAVTGGTLLLTLAATDRLHLKGLVDENEVSRVVVGQPARIRTEAYGERSFEGEVRDISPVGTRVQNVTYFEVEVEVVDADASLLRTRMSADADIVTEVVDDALVVPETSLRYAGESITVEVLGNGVPPSRELRPVEIGIIDDDRVQVLDGLAEGEQVTLQ